MPSRRHSRGYTSTLRNGSMAVGLKAGPMALNMAHMSVYVGSYPCMPPDGTWRSITIHPGSGSATTSPIHPCSL